MDIRGKLITWVRSFLIGRRQKVSIAGVSSLLTHVLSAISQSSVLGPLLFSILISDMPEVFNSLPVIRMYADDTKLFRTVNREADSTVLQKDLIAMQEWSNKWQLKFNADKCQILHIGSKNLKQKYYLIQSGKPVELHETKLENELDIHIDPELNFS